MYCVYIFQHKQNHKIYVGKTKDFSKRLVRHKKSMANPKQYFARALAKDGLDAFDYFILEKWEAETDCFEAESFWIAFFSSNLNDHGYNLTNGGEGSSGYKHTQEAISKMRTINTGPGNPRFGKRHTEQSRKLMSKRTHERKDTNSKNNSGEQNPNSKLSKSQVDEIRQLLSSKTMTFQAIADKFSVSKSTIERINYGWSWSPHQNQSSPKLDPKSNRSL